MIQVVIQDEFGTPLTATVDLSAAILPLTDDDRFTCARFIDPYGDTVFNLLQMPFLHKDLTLLKSQTQDATDKAAIEQIQRLIEQYQEDVHVYIKFIGD